MRGLPWRRPIENAPHTGKGRAFRGARRMYTGDRHAQGHTNHSGASGVSAEDQVYTGWPHAWHSRGTRGVSWRIACRTGGSAGRTSGGSSLDAR